jgi:putative addiction module component (TIGR02574 family)
MRRSGLWTELMELTPAERIELVEDLWDSIEPERLPPLSTGELDELDRELAEHRANPSGAQSWEAVRAWLRSRPR